jgi:serine phosphatase RsbU (regulator of sigma subunit)
MDKLRLILIFIIPALFGLHVTAQTNPDEIKSKIREYDQKAEQCLKDERLTDAAHYLNEAASLLQRNYRFEEAIGYYKQIVDINKRLNNQNGLMSGCNIIGMIYSDLEQYDNALPYLENVVRLSRELSNKEGIIGSLTNLALALYGLEKYEESNKRLEEAVKLAKEINNLKLLRSCYGMIYDNYTKLGNSEKAHEYSELYLSFDKELKKQEIGQVKSQAKSEVSKAYAEKQITENELTIKKEELKITTDSLQRAEEETREQRLKNQLIQAQLREEKLKSRYKSYGLIGISVFSVLLALMLILIIRANKEIKNQKNTLDRQNKNIRASIRYAETIQQAILPDTSLIDKCFESFVIFRPKDIVSGDFYWLSKSGSYKSGKGSFFVAVVDCTGHGVPGAFMSMIGNSLLNEMVNERNIDSPDEILELLNRNIRKSLRQDQTDNNDGMDLLLCRFDKLNSNGMKLTFAGAKRPLYIIHKDNPNIIKLKGDRKSIGGIEDSKDKVRFKNHEVNLKKGDCLYLSTDGIIDQNGPDRRRFGSNRLESLLSDCFNLSIKEQEEIINKELSNFMQSEEQRDDITLLGLRIL